MMLSVVLDGNPLDEDDGNLLEVVLNINMIWRLLACVVLDGNPLDEDNGNLFDEVILDLMNSLMM